MPTVAANWMGQKLGATPYQVIRHLQSGGMAIVYLGRDLHGGGRVVIKTPHADSLDETLPARFESEVEALRSLSHAHVVPILDAGEHDGMPFLVLPYLEGGTLFERLKRQASPQMPMQILEWLPDIAGALDFLHAKGWVHRDVKPGNILFDAQGKAYLADLGLTKCYTGTVRRALTRLGTPSPGTPRYMAPELLTGEVADGRSDQFSLAVMLYEMLTGLAPYAGDNPTAVLRNQALVHPTTLEHLRPDLPATVRAAIERGMAIKPAHRFGSCGELAEEFARLPAEPGTRTEAPTSLEPASLDEEGIGPQTWSIDHLASLEEEAKPLRAEAMISAPLPPLVWTPPRGEEGLHSLPPSMLPPPVRRRRPRILLGCFWVLVGLFLGGVLLPGTALHRAIAPPTARWVGEHFGITLPLAEEISETEAETAALKERVQTLADEVVAAREKSESEAKELAKLKESAADLAKRLDESQVDFRRVEIAGAALRKERDREKKRAGLLEREIPTLKTQFKSAEDAIDRARRVHEEIDAKVVFVNATEKRVWFKIGGQFWDETWGAWTEHSLAAGARETYTIHQAIWLRAQIHDRDDYEDIRPQIFLHGKDSLSVDVHYQFERKDGRTILVRVPRGK